MEAGARSNRINCQSANETDGHPFGLELRTRRGRRKQGRTLWSGPRLFDRTSAGTRSARADCIGLGWHTAPPDSANRDGGFEVKQPRRDA